MNMNLALCIVAIFIVLNILEKKFISKEKVNVKELTKYSAFVFSSTIAAEYALKKFKPEMANVPTQAFTSEPTF
jgi:hypothetical protein